MDVSLSLSLSIHRDFGQSHLLLNKISRKGLLKLLIKCLIT